jgi:hypothetical protein
VTLVLDGFWLPAEIKHKTITPETPWIVQYYIDGQPADANDPDAVGARWPSLTSDQWDALLDKLDAQRKPPAPDFLKRLEVALTQLSARFNDPHDPLCETALNAIPTYTGYSPDMIRFVLGALDLMPLHTLEAILDLELPGEVGRRFLSMKDISELEGRIRYYPSRPKNPLAKLFSYPSGRPFPLELRRPERVLGYAAGNVIGTSHLISLLGQVSSLYLENEDSGAARLPTILVKNSRQEPIFAPLIFSALEQIDPRLTETVALMIWDYEDSDLQERLLSKSDLVIAAAADFTIDQIEAVIRRVESPSHPIRFHPHGHKVSFTTIGGDYLKKDNPIQELANLETVDLVTLLAAVDSIFWDQYGCLSSRVHFVERGAANALSPIEYGSQLAEKIRLLSAFLPRGAIPLHGLHTRFEKYASMASSGEVTLCSTYEDDFLVVVDERPWSESRFQNVVNDCVERTIVVRPVEDLMQVPETYLGWLPPQNLQTMNVAIDGPIHSNWSEPFTRFVEGIGDRGVTAIRTIGRGPFPQLAYSWDGFLPLDLAAQRPPGRFTTVEFENTFAQIVETYQLYTSRIGLGAS